MLSDLLRMHPLVIGGLSASGQCARRSCASSAKTVGTNISSKGLQGSTDCHRNAVRIVTFGISKETLQRGCSHSKLDSFRNGIGNSIAPLNHKFPPFLCRDNVFVVPT